MKKKVNYNKYVLSTVGYGLVGLLGIIFGIHAILTQRYAVMIICALVVFVAYDNFFCGSRAKKCGGIAVKTHYVIPPLFKKK